MSLNSGDIQKIAELSKLTLSEEDANLFSAQLTKILALIEQIDSVDTQGLPPIAHSLERTQRLRADEVTEKDQREEYQKIAPDVMAGLYLVPQVIE